MRQLSKFEYDLALAIIIKDLKDQDDCERLESMTNMSWSSSNFSLSNQNLFDALLTFLEVPEESWSEDNMDGYCRDWVFNILMEMDSTLPVEQRAKIYLDKIIEGNQEIF